MTKEELEKEAEEYRLNLTAKLKLKLQEGCNCKELVDIEKAYLAGAESREKRASRLVALLKAERKRQEQCNDIHLRKIADLEQENVELKELIEKYRQAVDKCLHITFIGGGREVNTIGQYATLVDGYLTDVEGLAKLKS